jgi:putative DNA primase/helicase
LRLKEALTKLSKLNQFILFIMTQTISLSQQKSSILNLVKLLKPAKEKGKYVCPVCNGHNFSVNKTTGARKCWNGCSNESVNETIKALMAETQKSDRTEKASRERKTTEYLYNDRDGNPLIKVVKVVPGRNGKGKSIYQQHWNGKTWVKGYGPVKTPDIPLYRYAEVMAAIERGEPIVLCEGESTADAFWEKGIPATTTIGGTGKTVTKSTEDIDGQKVTRFKRNLNGLELIKPALADLMGADVILAPDRDKPGCLHSEMMAEQLKVKGWLYALPLNPQAWQQLLDKGGIDFVDWVHDYSKLTKQEILGYVVPAPTHQSLSSPHSQSQESPPVLPPRKRLQPGVVAKQLVQKYPHLRYIKDSQTWMKYESEFTGVWGEISTEEVEQLTMMYLEEIEQEELRSISYISEIVKFTQRNNKVFRRTWKETDNSRYLPFTNGVLDLQTGQLLEHDPKYHLTWTLPRPHNPEANQWEAIDAWLDFATQGKSGLRSILECFANAVLKGRCDLQKFLHLMGTGGSGKGTYMRLITSLIGANNVVTSSLERLCSNRFEAARLYHKRLVLFSDERSKPRDISEFMKLTGQDMLPAEKKQKEAFDFAYEGMVILASEFPLFYGETGEGLKRRTILLPMTARVEDKDRRNLQADFESELAAFTNHLLSIPDEFVSEVLRSLEDSPEVNLYSWQSRLREDSIAAWLDERLIYDSESVVPISKLYEDYRNFCEQTGHQFKSQTRFSPELLEVCLSIQWQVSKKKHNQGRSITGVKLRRYESFENYPSHETQLEEKINSKSDGLGDGLVTGWVTGCNADEQRKVTGVTGFSNLVGEEKKLEKFGCQNERKLVVQDTPVPSVLPSDYDTFKTELREGLNESKAKVSRVGEKAFKAKFSDPDEVEKHLQSLEDAKKITRNHGYIYNAYNLLFEKGKEVIFKGKDGVKYYGKIESMNFPHYTIMAGENVEYIHCLDIKRKQ